MQGHVDTRAALELVRIHNRLAQRDEPQRALGDVDELIERVVNERSSIRRLEKYARELEGGRAGRWRERGSAAPQRREHAASSGRGAAAAPAVPADGPPYRLDEEQLVLDVDRIARRDVSPEEREELITVLEQLLTLVRRAVGTDVRRRVLHVENARDDADP